MPAYRGEMAAHHPKFPLDSLTACTEMEGSVPIDAPDIVYSELDDEAIAKFGRDRGGLFLIDYRLLLNPSPRDHCSIHGVALGQLIN